jgi:AraC-like DNA-binding protein
MAEMSTRRSGHDARSKPAVVPGRLTLRGPGSFRAEWAPPSALERHVAYVWAERSDRAEPLLPDGAVELVWSGNGLFVRGADTRAYPVGRFPNRTFVGLRFRPGAASEILGLRGAELADARVGVSQLWGRSEMERLEEILAACSSARQAGDVLEAAVKARIREAPDPAVEQVVAALATRVPDVRVCALARWIGLSERQLLRRCTSALGYGPKTLDRIFRFQRFRSLALRLPHFGLAELAAAAGYADQPHLTRECVRLAGETPTALLARL